MVLDTMRLVLYDTRVGLGLSRVRGHNGRINGRIIVKSIVASIVAQWLITVEYWAIIVKLIVAFMSGSMAGSPDGLS